MTASVLIPFRPGCPYRERALEWIVAKWKADFPDFEVLLERDEAAGPWRKGAVVQKALDRSSGDVIVIADADTWSFGVAAAVQKVVDGAPWVMPQTDLARLTEASTGDVLAGGSIEAAALQRSSWLHQLQIQATAGGVVVLRREVALAVPIDPRFEGWGGEDLAHRFALEVLAGRRTRIPGKLVHLFHPPAPERGTGALTGKSERLRKRYALALHDPHRMKALIVEARWRPRLT